MAGDAPVRRRRFTLTRPTHAGFVLCYRETLASLSRPTPTSEPTRPEPATRPPPLQYKTQPPPRQAPPHQTRPALLSPLMERVQAEAAMALYDAFWFHRLVLLPSPPPAPEPQQVTISSSSSTSSSPTHAAGPRHRRTRSDEFQQGLEPLRIPTNTTTTRAARLETILSGKDGMVAAPQPLPDRVTRRPAGGARRRRRRRGRSMSELEFEELQGLQDLGFTFSDAEVDAELASIVPGLRRLRSGEVEPLATAASAPPALAAASSSSSSAHPQEEAAVAVPHGSAPRRPYLSEAWDDEEEEVRAMLRNWRIPPAVEGADLKEHLRMWAHTVASAVR